MWRIWAWIKEVGKEFIDDRAPQQAASIAFYTMISLAPLLVVVIAIAGMVFGREAAQGAIVGEFQGVLGEGAGAMIQEVVARAATRPDAGVVATIIGIATLLIGAIGVFGQLKGALNVMWDVTLKPGGFWGFVRGYILSFAMLIALAFLLLTSLALSAIIAAATSVLGDAAPAWIAAVIDFIVATTIVAALFAALFKFIPDVKIAWRDVLIGAVVTSVLFNLGKFLIGLYLGRAAIVGVYGAAGSLVMVLLWVYYSAIIVLLGAEFTQVFARRRGARIVPSPRARPADECELPKAPSAHRPERRGRPAPPRGGGEVVGREVTPPAETSDEPARPTRPTGPPESARPARG